MRLEELVSLTEATDISDFGRELFNETLPEVDAKLHKEFSRVFEPAKQQNPEDPVDAAYEILQSTYEDRTHQPHHVLRMMLSDSVTKTLREYIKQRFGGTFQAGKDRDEYTVNDVRVEFLKETGTDQGHYRRSTGFTGKLAIRVAIPHETLQETFNQWFSEFITGNTTIQIIEEDLRPYIRVLIHEVTHLVNDISGSAGQNTAMLKQGKAYNDETIRGDYAEKVMRELGMNLFHLSRTSEIQAFASEIAWELAEDVLTNKVFERDPVFGIQRIDDIIEDLSYGGFSETLQQHSKLLKQAKELAPAKRAQLDRIWKKLLGQIVRNLQKYRARLVDKAKEMGDI